MSTPIETISFSPVDNARLMNLCGALDDNLRQIESAKEQWAMEQDKGDGDAVGMADLLGNGNFRASYLRFSPACRAGGAYIVNPIGTSAACSYYAGHNL